MSKELSNREFAQADAAFTKACENAGVKATVRQASKFRNKKGAAYSARKKGGE